MNEQQFNELVAALAKANGLDEDTAAHYASLIGDTPELAPDGRAIVRDEYDHEIARVIFPSE